MARKLKSRDSESAVVTIAAIRKPKAGVTQYLFNERHQIFTMPAATAKRASTAKLMKAAVRENNPVRVGLDPARGVIQYIETPTPEEIEAFNRTRILSDIRGTTRAIDLAKIDPMVFNVVDLHLKSPIFKLCKRTIPNYKKAKKIFDFCAKQTCSLGGPFDISPCIPFQYVIDGCYARAHKMRKIITTKYRYCCDKVFSFANQGNDTLAVKADKWGGCCVQWWYHVAPLVRVQFKLGTIHLTLAMVIDPGMFDKPVLLSTWLAAQENLNCSAAANVSTYSIQPGSAYAPANYQGTMFSTDPTYTLTDGTLTNYMNLVTC